MRLSPSALKNLHKRIWLWLVGIALLLIVASIRHDLVGAMVGFGVLILTLMCDEYLKEGYWFNIKEAAPQTHEATITELSFGLLVLLAFYLLKFGLIGCIAALIIFTLVALSIVL